MSYVPKKKLKVKWKVAVPFFTLILLVVYLVFNLLISPDKGNDNGYTICGFTPSKTASFINKTFENQYEISDYFYYGETLNLLKQPYDVLTADEMVGKTLKLVDICTGKELMFSLENKADHQLNLAEVENGFYEVYLVYNLSDQRIVMKEPLKDVFHTVTRNNASKKVELIAHKGILNDEETLLDQNYMFINVTSDTVQHDSVDIMLDPAGGNDDYGMGVDWGYDANGLNENDEMYAAALALKEKLEGYGFTVGITKDSIKQEINTYGLNGRLYKAYEKNAKYYINLQFNSSSYNYLNGMEVYYSNYASSTLANQLLFDMKKNIDLDGSSLYTSGTSVDGVVPPVLAEGDDGRAVYDSILQIREAGGVATQAGMISERSRTENSFATANKHGMQAVVIKYLYISNDEDAEFWKTNFDKIISETANSIASYLKVTKE